MQRKEGKKGKSLERVQTKEAKYHNEAIKDTKKDKSLGSFTWYLIWTPHNYPLKHTPTESSGGVTFLARISQFSRVIFH